MIATDSIHTTTLPTGVFYAHPYDCPHFYGSWADRVCVRPAPIGFDVPGPCWIWLGWNNGKPSGAYGKVKINGRTDYIHRVMWERHNGVYLQGGETIDHLCRVRLCFNPYHLENVDYSENRQRAVDYAARFSETTYDPELEAEIAAGFGL